MAAPIKKCRKLHNFFMAELTRSTQLESDGSQVLSSLANVSQRLPTLLQSNESSKAMGVLHYSCNAHVLLVQKHMLALETSFKFLTEILRDYQALLYRLRSYTNDCVALIDDAMHDGESGEEEVAAIAFPVQLQEWMDTVVAMFEHEVVRKTRLVADLESSDPTRLNAVVNQWKARGKWGNIDHDYVETGLHLPQVNESVATKSGDTTLSLTKKRKKKNASKQRGG